MSELSFGSPRIPEQSAVSHDDLTGTLSTVFDWGATSDDYVQSDDLDWDEGIHKPNRQSRSQILTQSQIVDAIESLHDSVEGVNRRLDAESKRFDFLIRTVEQAMQEVRAHSEEAELTALRREFELLAAKWEEETSGYSASSDEIIHPAYLRIIGMGKSALPWILEEMSENHGQWFVALEAITGENPIHEEDYGRRPKMRSAWQDWGRKNGWIT